MSVIAVVNRKGGSGKSTLATHLAAHFANSGVPVMLGDVDRQQSTQSWLRSRNLRELPKSAPIVGWVANTWGPRAAVMVGAASGIVAALIAIAWLVLHRHLRVSYRIHRTPHLLVTHDGDGRDRRADAREDIEADEAVARRT